MRIVGHLDMDAFFAAIEERDNERFKSKPIVVGSDPLEGRGRGVVSTANYKAREYGIYSATPISRAWRLSEEAKNRGQEPVIFIGVNFHKYTKSSKNIIEIVKKYSPLVEKASIDEAYFDLTFTGSFERAENICKKIKNKIRAKEKLTASIGIGPNRLIAKIASDFKKPDGLTVVKHKDVEKFLEPLSIRKIPGIGPKTEIILKREGIMTIKDLKQLNKDSLTKKFGKWGLEMYERARGHDDSLIREFYEIKSIGEQETFNEDTLKSEFIFSKIDLICKDIIRRLKKSEFNSFKTVVITVRFSDFITKSRSHTLKESIDSFEGLKFEALKLVIPFLDSRENPKNKLIRLVGVRIEKLGK